MGKKNRRGKREQPMGQKRGEKRQVRRDGETNTTGKTEHALLLQKQRVLNVTTDCVHVQLDLRRRKSTYKMERNTSWEKREKEQGKT